MPWLRSHRAHQPTREIADRHYNRQKVGAPQFVPPGRCVVLYHDSGKAFWVTSWPFGEYVKHAWPGAWICSAFRNEGAEEKASELILSALAISRFQFGDPPDSGLVTFIDTEKVRPIFKRGAPTWGYTWRKAGFEEAGYTAGGLLALQLKLAMFPPKKFVRRAP